MRELHTKAAMYCRRHSVLNILRVDDLTVSQKARDVFFVKQLRKSRDARSHSQQSLHRERNQPTRILQLVWTQVGLHAQRRLYARPLKQSIEHPLARVARPTFAGFAATQRKRTPCALKIKSDHACARARRAQHRTNDVFVVVSHGRST